MWSYRMYRYPTPSSSSLVSGSGKADEIMSRDSPESIGGAVYRALQGGTKLPSLDNSAKVRKSLLEFRLPTSQPVVQQADLDNGNDVVGQDDRGVLAQSEERNGKYSTSSDRNHHKQTDDEIESEPYASTLMMEALSKRRMDAVRELHEACPQLLASIPLFDRLSEPDSDTAETFSTPTYSRQSTSFGALADSTAFICSSNYCSFPKASKLLDVASENRALLVFVLQYHPGVDLSQCRQKMSAKGKKQIHLHGKEQQESEISNRRGEDPKNPEFKRSNERQSEANANAPVCSTQAQENTGKQWSHGSTFDDDETKEEKLENDPLIDMDPNSPITICIRKNNPEVLQYLLFKHVWQHFLLDEIFKLQQNRVPDRTPINSCSECAWFLPCAAVVGCPYLLDLILCGKFCNHHFSVLRAGRTTAEDLQGDTKQTEEAIAEPYTDDSVSQAERNGTISKSDQINSETGVTKPKAPSSTMESCEASCTEAAQSPDENKMAEHEEEALLLLSSNSPSVTTLCAQTNAGNIPAGNLDLENSPTIPNCSKPESIHVSDCSRTCSQVLSDTSQPAFQSVSPSEIVHRPSEIVHRPSRTGFDTSIASYSHEPSCSHNREPEVLTVYSEYHLPDFSGSARRPLAPEANLRVSISLPIMDRWISRCAHVRLSPLHLASWRCDLNSIRVLMKHGADVTVMAEELAAPELERGEEGNVLDSSGSRGASNRSSNTSLDMTLNFVSVTLNTSSSMDLVADSCNKLEDKLKSRSQDDQGIITPLALLALGIRSPPDFSLSVGKSLGLVLPTLPELWGGQIDRSCPQAKVLVMETLKILIDAGCSINQASTVFGKTFRVVELFLQPSLDLYYAPLMPRGGRDSAVLRCMDLERVAEVVLGVCWELCSRGARIGASFAASLEWNLFHMDWMFLQNESLQRRFLHLAIFLGLFPPLAPAVIFEYLAASGLGKVATEFSISRIWHAQREAGPSGGGTDLTEPHLPPFSDLSRPSCVPWAPSTSRTVTPPLSGTPSAVGGEEGLLSARAGNEATELVVSYYSSNLMSESNAAQAAADTQTSLSDAGNNFTLGLQPDVSNDFQQPESERTTTAKGSETARKTSVSFSSSSTIVRAHVMWTLEERQRKYLDRFVNDVLRLTVPQSSLVLICQFICLPDLRLLHSITQHMLSTSTAATETTLQRLNDVVCRAQGRTLRHSCKLVILMSSKWHYSAILCLPLPESLKRYLLDCHC